jgi:hypothetical protein
MHRKVQEMKSDVQIYGTTLQSSVNRGQVCMHTHAFQVSKTVPLSVSCSYQIARNKYQSLMVKSMYDKNMDNGEETKSPGVRSNEMVQPFVH